MELERPTYGREWIEIFDDSATKIIFRNLRGLCDAYARNGKDIEAALEELRQIDREHLKNVELAPTTTDGAFEIQEYENYTLTIHMKTID